MLYSKKNGKENIVGTIRVVFFKKITETLFGNKCSRLASKMHLFYS